MQISDRIKTITKDLSNMYDVLSMIKSELVSSYKQDIGLRGKTLRQANIEHSSLLGYYDEIRINLQSLHDYLELRLAEKKAKVIRYIVENSSHEYGERMIDKLVEDDPQYIELKLKNIEVNEVYELSKAIVRQFEQRSYSLNNISRLVVAQAQDDSLILTHD